MTGRTGGRPPGPASRLLDFSSSLYLGLRHESRSLTPWDALTEGKPSAVQEPPGALKVAEGLASLIGSERAVLVPSTLHLFWDLFGVLTHDRTAIYVDAGAYPIARWGAEHAAARGTPLRFFAHHDATALSRLLTREARSGVRPVIVADGFCPGCGRSAPLLDYLDAARKFGGLLLIDDTQALGVLGHSPGPSAPFGFGGGGSLRHWGVEGPDILTGASLAKAFGAPVAVLAGGAIEIRRFLALSETRVHCSPPSVAAVHAAARALEVNHACGDTLRSSLAELIARFRTRLAEAGLATPTGFFPVQRVALPSAFASLRLHERLLRRGVRAVPVNGGSFHGPGLIFLINVGHHPGAIDRAAIALDSALAEAGTCSGS